MTGRCHSFDSRADIFARSRRGLWYNHSCAVNGCAGRSRQLSAAVWAQHEPDGVQRCGTALRVLMSKLAQGLMHSVGVRCTARACRSVIPSRRARSVMRCWPCWRRFTRTALSPNAQLHLLNPHVGSVMCASCCALLTNPHPSPLSLLALTLHPHPHPSPSPLTLTPHPGAREGAQKVREDKKVTDSAKGAHRQGGQCAAQPARVHQLPCACRLLVRPTHTRRGSSTRCCRPTRGDGGGLRRVPREAAGEDKLAQPSQCSESVRN